MAIILNGATGITSPNIDSQVGANTPAAGNFTTANVSGALSIEGGILSPQTGFKNRIINGDMRIDQRNSGASISGSIGYASNYVPDRFATALNLSNNSTISLQQVVDAPSGFYNSLKVTATSATAQSTTNQYFFVAQAIEMLNVLDFNFVSGASSPCVLSFWVKTSVAGVYSASIAWGNGSSILSGLLRSYVADYTVTTANVWQYVTVSIPTDTFVGTLSLTQTINILFDLGSGVGRSKEPNSWVSNSRTRSTNQTAFLNTVANATWQVTGVQLEKGSVATSFEFRSIGQELALCQRYFEAGFVIDYQNSNNSSAAFTSIPIGFLVSKRAAPTVTYTGTTLTNISSIQTQNISTNGFGFRMNAGNGVIAVTTTVTASIEL
jgi:hypothetical protein